MAYKKKSTPILKEVFADEPTDIIAEERQAYEGLEGEGGTIKQPVLPEIYNRLPQVDMNKTLSQRSIYSALSKFTPFLVQNLLYIAQSPQASKRDQIQASKILLDKIMPSLEAQHIQLDGDKVQGLVIVKATKDKSD